MRLGVGLVAMACGTPHSGVQVGNEGGDIDVCGDEVPLEGGYDEPLIDTHDGNEALAILAGPRVIDAVWYDGATDPVTISVAPASTTVRAFAYPDGIEGCAERIVFDAELVFVSASGSVDVAVPFQATWSYPWTTIDVGVQVPVPDFDTTLPLASIAPDADLVFGWFRFDDALGRGRLELSTPTPNRPDGQEDQRFTLVEW